MNELIAAIEDYMKGASRHSGPHMFDIESTHDGQFYNSCSLCEDAHNRRKDRVEKAIAKVKPH